MNHWRNINRRERCPARGKRKSLKHRFRCRDEHRDGRRKFEVENRPQVSLIQNEGRGERHDHTGCIVRQFCAGPAAPGHTPYVVVQPARCLIGCGGLLPGSCRQGAGRFASPGQRLTKPVGILSPLCTQFPGVGQGRQEQLRLKSPAPGMPRHRGWGFLPASAMLLRHACRAPTPQNSPGLCARRPRH